MSLRMDPDADMAMRSGFAGTPVAGNRQREDRSPAGPRSVLVVVAMFNYDVKLCPREAKAIARALHGYPFKAAIYASRMIGYIVETDLTADELMERVREPLAAGCVERGWVFTPGADVASNLPLDPFEEKVAEAWINVRRFNHRHGGRRSLPERLTHIVAPIEGARGEVVTPILDRHPLIGRAF